MAQPSYNAITKCRLGKVLKHRNITRNTLKSFVSKIERDHNVICIFFYKLPNKQYCGYYSPKSGYHLPGDHA